MSKPGVKTRISTAVALAVAAFGIVPPAALAQSHPTPSSIDITGVWIGTRNDPDAPYKNTYLPNPPFTPYGEKMSKYWSDPLHNLGERCLPGGGPAGAMGGSALFPIETIQKDGQVTILVEDNEMVRRVFTDGRKHKPDLDPSWMGESIGHWEGDTLVIDTVGVHQGSMNGSGAAVIKQAGDAEPRLPYSSKMHMTERLRMLDGGKYLEDVETFDDPLIYSRPITYKRYWRRAPEITPMEYVCAENQRVADEGGDPNLPPLDIPTPP
jgi:hypothetical protein